MMWQDETEKGLFTPGDGLLHDLDPRLKVVACLLLVMLTFSSVNWVSLVLVALALTGATLFSGLTLQPWLRASWGLRWLLLFTLLMHLLMSPGRTLWGTTWLSLDGLLAGLRVDLQIVLALFAAQLLTRTTTAEDLARTFGWFLSPLERCGCRVEEWRVLMLRAIQFLPIVRSEVQATDTTAMPASSGKLSGRWDAWSERLEGLLLRLVERGDVQARELAAAEPDVGPEPGLPPLFPPAARETVFLAALVSLVLLCRLTG